MLTCIITPHERKSELISIPEVEYDEREEMSSPGVLADDSSNSRKRQQQPQSHLMPPNVRDDSSVDVCAIIYTLYSNTFVLIPLISSSCQYQIQ